MWLRCLSFLLAGLVTPSLVIAGPMLVTVTDTAGNRLENAVVSIHGDTPSLATPFTIDIMDQVNRQFLPTVLPIQQGTQVAFPNTDDVRHHVYSFSAPNQFEIKLYHGRPGKPVTFEHSGVVVLGCNIHDDMLGYLRVVSTPWFAATAGDGLAGLEVPVPGQYTLQVWHPDMGMRIDSQPITVTPSLQQVTVAIDTAPAAAETAAGSPAAATPSAEERELQSLFDF